MDERSLDNQSLILWGDEIMQRIVSGEARSDDRSLIDMIEIVLRMRWMTYRGVLQGKTKALTALTQEDGVIDEPFWQHYERQAKITSTFRITIEEEGTDDK